MSSSTPIRAPKASKTSKVSSEPMATSTPRVEASSFNVPFATIKKKTRVTPTSVVTENPNVNKMIAGFNDCFERELREAMNTCLQSYGQPTVPANFLREKFNVNRATDLLLLTISYINHETTIGLMYAGDDANESPLSVKVKRGSMWKCVGKLRRAQKYSQRQHVTVFLVICFLLKTGGAWIPAMNLLLSTRREGYPNARPSSKFKAICPKRNLVFWNIVAGPAVCNGFDINAYYFKDLVREALNKLNQTNATEHLSFSDSPQARLAWIDLLFKVGVESKVLNHTFIKKDPSTRT